MNMTVKTEHYTVVKERVIGVTCDFCGHSENTHCWGGGSINISFGYGSVHDDHIFSGDICDECFGKLFEDKLRVREA